MKLYTNETRAIGTRDPMIYGHFLEHFHRQVYDGVYCPGSPLAGRMLCVIDYEGKEVRVYTVAGETTESYNDIDYEEVRVEEGEIMPYTKGMAITLKPHSANVIRIN